MKLNTLSETAITLTFDDKISTETHQKIIRLYWYLNDLGFPWIVDIVPAYSSVSVFVSLDFYKHHSSLKEYFANIFSEFTVFSHQKYSNKNEVIKIKVDYNGEDLTYVAEYCKLTVNEVILIHSAAEYTVALIGFSPGFPYLLGLDERLIVPRRATPRLKVPRGSVAIGGVQTGIYPQESPGGWHIIGTISENLFSVNQNPPNFFNAGDRIRFIR